MIFLGLSFFSIPIPFVFASEKTIFLKKKHCGFDRWGRARGVKSRGGRKGQTITIVIAQHVCSSGFSSLFLNKSPGRALDRDRHFLSQVYVSRASVTLFFFLSFSFNPLIE